jgi:hypothetical protein
LRWRDVNTWIVVKTDGVDVEYRMMMMDTIEGGIVSDDEGEIGDEEEIVQHGANRPF